jgi:hypothetical protein
MVMCSQRDNDFGDFGAEFPAFLLFGRGRFYQCFRIAARQMQQGYWWG